MDTPEARENPYKVIAENFKKAVAKTQERQRVDKATQKEDLKHKEPKADLGKEVQMTKPDPP